MTLAVVVRQERHGKKMERSGMRKKSRTGLFCLLAIFSITALNSRADFSGGSLSAQEDLLVRPDETVHDLLNEGDGKETAALAAGRNGLWRTGGIFVLGVGLGVFLLLSWLTVYCKIDQKLGFMMLMALDFLNLHTLMKIMF